MLGYGLPLARICSGLPHVTRFFFNFEPAMGKTPLETACPIKERHQCRHPAEQWGNQPARERIIKNSLIHFEIIKY